MEHGRRSASQRRILTRRRIILYTILCVLCGSGIIGIIVGFVVGLANTSHNFVSFNSTSSSTGSSTSFNLCLADPTICENAGNCSVIAFSPYYNCICHNTSFTGYNCSVGV